MEGGKMMRGEGETGRMERRREGEGEGAQGEGVDQKEESGRGSSRVSCQARPGPVGDTCHDHAELGGSDAVLFSYKSPIAEALTFVGNE